jgi:hypothetical protein
VAAKYSDNGIISRQEVTRNMGFFEPTAINENIIEAIISGQNNIP